MKPLPTTNQKLKTSPTGISLIKRFEGFSATPYICPAGYKTIGYGHLITANSPLNTIEKISSTDATILLISDLRTAEAAISRLITAPLSQNQFDALSSFTFNLGAGALQRSTLRTKINRMEYSAVPQQLMRYVFANGKKLSGLTARRQAECALWVG